MGDAGLGQAQRVLCLAVVVTLVSSTGQTEVQLAVLLVRDLLDLLLRQSLHIQQLVVPVPVVGGGRVCVSSTLQHEPANISGDISGLSRLDSVMTGNNLVILLTGKQGTDTRR